MLYPHHKRFTPPRMFSRPRGGVVKEAKFPGVLVRPELLGNNILKRGRGPSSRGAGTTGPLVLFFFLFLRDSATGKEYRPAAYHVPPWLLASRLFVRIGPRSCSPALLRTGNFLMWIHHRSTPFQFCFLFFVKVTSVELNLVWVIHMGDGSLLPVFTPPPQSNPHPDTLTVPFDLYTPSTTSATSFYDTFLSSFNNHLARNLHPPPEPSPATLLLT